MIWYLFVLDYRDLFRFCWFYFWLEVLEMEKLEFNRGVVFIVESLFLDCINVLEELEL